MAKAGVNELVDSELVRMMSWKEGRSAFETRYLSQYRMPTNRSYFR